MKNTLLLPLLFFLYSSHAQDSRSSIYAGLYTGGLIETYYPQVTSPYFIKLHYYTLSFNPKLGYRYKNLTLGVIGNYSFHKNTLETLEPVLGYGYFAKYNFPKKITSRNKTVSIQSFVEWTHVIETGYYVRLPDYWHRAKVDSQTTYFSGQVGLDLLLPKSFSIGLGIGFGSTNFLKDFHNLDGAKVFRIRPYGNITIQYNLKLSKNPN